MGLLQCYNNTGYEHKTSQAKADTEQSRSSELMKAAARQQNLLVNVSMILTAHRLRVLILADPLASNLMKAVWPEVGEPEPSAPLSVLMLCHALARCALGLLLFPDDALRLRWHTNGLWCLKISLCCRDREVVTTAA